MTKPLDPETKALKAIMRALRPLDTPAKDRVTTEARSKVEDELRRELR